MTVADVVVRELRAAGVRAIFGVPGGGNNLDLIDAARRADLPFVLTASAWCVKGRVRSFASRQM